MPAKNTKSRKSTKYKKYLRYATKKRFAQHSSGEIFDKRKYKATISAQKYLIKYAGTIAYYFLLFTSTDEMRSASGNWKRLKEHTRIDL